MSVYCDEEPHTGIFLRAFASEKSKGPAHEILIFEQFIENVGVVIQKEYNFSNGIYYQLENTYGEALLIVYADKILYPDGTKYNPAQTTK